MTIHLTHAYLAGWMAWCAWQGSPAQAAAAVGALVVALASWWVNRAGLG